MKRKIVKPLKREQSFNLCVYECRVCGATLKYGNINEKNPSYPNFCWCCGTQLKEVDEKFLNYVGLSRDGLAKNIKKYKNYKNSG